MPFANTLTAEMFAPSRCHFCDNDAFGYRGV